MKLRVEAQFFLNVFNHPPTLGFPYDAGGDTRKTFHADWVSAYVHNFSANRLCWASAWAGIAVHA